MRMGNDNSFEISAIKTYPSSAKAGAAMTAARTTKVFMVYV